MAIEGDARLRSASAWPALRSWQGLALLSIALAPLLLAAWQVKPLYFSNQNTKYLHALAASGVGFLREDWLTQTKDGLPLFTWLLEIIYAALGPFGFYLAALVSTTIFLYCALLLYRRLTAGHPVPLQGLALFLATLFVLATFTDMQEIVFQGFAEQRMLGGYFQTADFGIFLICAVLFFDRDKLLPATMCTLLAAAMHPGYVAPGGVLIAIFLLYELRLPSSEGGVTRIAKLSICVLGLVALAVMAIALKQLFAATDPQTQHEAHRILTDVRIPRHASPWVWFNINVVLQSAICLAAALMLPAGRLRFTIGLGLAAMIGFTLIAFLPGIETYRLIAPWRISVALVPLATITLCALAVIKLSERGTFRPERARRLMASSVGVIVLCALAGSAFTAAKAWKDEPAYLSFVRSHLGPGQLYLTPPGLTDFRLQTGVPHYVTFKSHPYQDVEVLEWHRRLTLAEDIFRSASMDCERVRRLAKDEGVTHVLTMRAPTLSCDFAPRAFQDERSSIYTIDRSKL